MTSTAKDFNAVRIAFMNRASAPNVMPLAFKLGWMLCFRYMNRETGIARPSQDTLARDLNVSIRTIQRLIDILEPLGLTVVRGNGRSHANRYCLDPERATRVSPFNPQSTTPVSSFSEPERVTNDAVKGDSRRQKRVTRVSPEPIEENQEEEPLGGANAPPQGRESARGSLALASPGAAAEGGAPEGKSRQPVSEGVVLAPADRFAELRAIWVRPWPDDDETAARRAHAEAIREGADPDDIDEAARVWVAAVEARFLPPLPKWLAGRGYEKPPPSRKPRRNGGKVSLAEISLRRGHS